MRRLVLLIASMAAVACSSDGRPTATNNPGDQNELTAITSVVVSPSDFEVKLNKSLQLSATVKDASGAVRTDKVVAWSSDDPTVLQVSSTGNVTGKKLGKAKVRAIVETVEGDGSATVAPMPVAKVQIAPTKPVVEVAKSVQLTSAVYDADNVELTDRVVTWTSSNAGVATVSATGLVAGATVGTAIITATSEGIKDTTTVTVSAAPPAPVSAVSVSLASTSISVGATTQGTATLRDAQNNVLTGRVVTWSSSATGIATVNSTGRVTAIAAGTAVITATSEGKSGSASLTVTVPAPAPVSTVTLSLAASSISVGQTTQGTVVLRDAQNNVLTGRTITYSSSATGVATVNGSGLVTAVATGSATITATSEGKSGTATVTVTAPAPAPVSTVALTLAASSLTVGQTTQGTVVLRDAQNNVLTGRTITYSSNATSIASVNSSGLVTAIGAGTTTITATSEGKSGTASITVTTAAPPPPPQGCTSPQTGWIFCDDFEQDRSSSYFEYDAASGGFSRLSGSGRNGGYAMRAHFNAGQVSAGSLKLGFGRVPSTSFKPVDGGTATYREIYWRFYFKNQAGWTGGGGDKMTRATVFAKSDWSQAMIGHVWSGSSPNENYLVADPASGTNSSGTVVTSGYNDFANLTWFGATRGTVPIFDASHVGQWYCIEAHVKLNDAGQANGLEEFWIDGQLDARKTGINFVSTYTDYSLNAIFLENYWNAGSPAAQDRYFDDFVVSTAPIGCGTATQQPAPVATVSVTLGSSSVQAGGSTQATAVTRDASNNVLTGRTITWTSSNTAVATVSSSGAVTAVAAGTAQITATSEGKSGAATLTVTSAPPPPPPGTSNEPSGMTAITNQPMNSLTADGWAPYGNVSIVQDATSPGTPSSVSQMTFPTGFVGGSGPANLERSLTQTGTIYISFWLKLSSNWQGHSTGTNKIMHLWTGGLNRVFLYASGVGTGKLEPSIGLQGVVAAPGGTTTNLYPNQSGAPAVARGQWQHWELVIKGNSSGATDGTIEWWINGVKAGSYSGIQYTSGAAKWELVKYNPTWGGIGDVVSSTQYMWADDIYFSGR